MDFHLLQRVRSHSAKESLKKLKRPKIKIKSPEWMSNDHNTEDKNSTKKRRAFFPEDTLTSSSSEDEMDLKDSVILMSQRLKALENHISMIENRDRKMTKMTTAPPENKASTPFSARKRLSFDKVTPTKKIDKGLRIDPTLNRQRSFWDYVLDDFDWRSVSTPREAMLEQQRLNNFQQIPWAIESLQCFGFLVCFDTLLYVFTIVPVRVVLASMKMLLLWPLSKLLGSGGGYVGRRHVYDIFRGFLLISTCGLLYFMELSIVYHYLRSQSGIKLYVLFGILDIFDRLLTSIGQDVIEALHTTTLRGITKNKLRIVLDFFSAMTYILIHSMLKFVQLVTLNVAMNSKSNAVLTLVISSNFAEMKSLVFKRFDESNVFQISCADIVERFMLLIFLALVFVQNWAQSSLSVFEYVRDKSFQHQFIVAAQIWGCEVLVDWIKHAFVSKFNKISYKSYEKFALIIGNDMLSHRRVAFHNNMDSTHAVTQRLGLASFPLTCVIVRICGSHLSRFADLQTSIGYVVLLMSFMCVFALKILSSQLLMAYCMIQSRRSERGVNNLDLGKLASIKRYTLHKNRIP